MNVLTGLRMVQTLNFDGHCVAYMERRAKLMATKEKTLADAFHETLKDVYFAEKAALKALKKSAKAAAAPELKTAFEVHATETVQQIERLTQVFAIISKPARAKTCKAMQGITAEMDEDLEDFGGTEAADAVLIGCAQAVEHYEIARYGMLKAWAQKLGLTEAATLFGQTLEEEKRTDTLLSKIAAQDGKPAAKRTPPKKTPAQTDLADV